ncbi:MAG: BrnA antitoxin family protein [Proteobacteria bacterium]|nr:BrnA antitoxin family protein [Pseudomonadota bacterium]
MSTVRKSPNKKPVSKKRLAELQAKTDKDIDYSDISATSREFWETARVVMPEEPKQQISMRVDLDVLEYFKAMGKGYQTRMNAVLRSYMAAHEEDPRPRR